MNALQGPFHMQAGQELLEEFLRPGLRIHTRHVGEWVEEVLSLVRLPTREPRANLLPLLPCIQPAVCGLGLLPDSGHLVFVQTGRAVFQFWNGFQTEILHTQCARSSVTVLISINVDRPVCRSGRDVQLCSDDVLLLVMYWLTRY